MTGRNLQRYSNAHKLSPAQYTHMLLLTRLFIRGVEVFGSKEKFGRWLRKPVRSLGTQKPIDLLSSTVGYTVVEQVLGRIEHGVFG
jgi:putative toxin-antitoxin system antitoxin component (TIGR02293 family)